MLVPIRLRDFLIVSLPLCLVLFFLYFTEKAYLFWFLVLIPIFLAGWVWQQVGALVVSIIVLAVTSNLIYQETLSQNISLSLSSLLLQVSLGFVLIFLGGLGVGKISEVAAQEEKVIKQITLKDKTTNLFTAAYFKLRLAEEMKRSERFEMPFALLFISIDRLEEFRDTFGNFRTEILQRKIARLIESSLREIDIAARCESNFAVILPGVKTKGSLKVADRIRETVERSEFEGDEVEPMVKKTLSIGLAEFPKDAFDEIELITTVEKLMTEAGARGGNQVISAAPLVQKVSG